MKVFVDTNILIDYVCCRAGFEEGATRIFALGYLKKLELVTSALSYVTTMYVASKYDYQNVKKSLKAVSDFVTIQDLCADTVVKMLLSDWKDYEDSVQYHSAILSKADCIVTRNKKDFKKSELPVYTIDELFDLLM